MFDETISAPPVGEHGDTCRGEFGGGLGDDDFLVSSQSEAGAGEPCGHQGSSSGHRLDHFHARTTAGMHRGNGDVGSVVRTGHIVDKSEKRCCRMSQVLDIIVVFANDDQLDVGDLGANPIEDVVHQPVNGEVVRFVGEWPDEDHLG